MTEINLWVLAAKVAETDYRSLALLLGFNKADVFNMKHNIKVFPEVTFHALFNWIHKSDDVDASESMLKGVLNRLGLWKDELSPAGGLPNKFEFHPVEDLEPLVQMALNTHK